MPKQRREMAMERNHQRKSHRMMAIKAFPVLALWNIIVLGCADAYISPFSYDESSEGRCIGLQADFSKLEDIKTEDIDRIQNPSGNRNFEMLSMKRITRADGETVLKDRVRLIERIDGIKIRGGDVVVNFKGCNSFICGREVESLQGKTFREINVTQGYITNVTLNDVQENIARIFGASEDAIGELSLEVFAATDSDHLAFFTDVLVEKGDEIKFFSIIMDAHSLDILSICNLAGPDSLDIGRSHGTGGGRGKGKGPQLRRLGRRLRSDPSISRNGIVCGSCMQEKLDVTWGETYSSCPINSLYLDDTGRNTTCLVGTTAEGETVFGAGPVPELHWDGTQDCKSTTDQCFTTVLPDCNDAISDVQYGAIKTLQYFQEYLGIMGGLSESAESPVPIMAKVHYNKNYCNAFYRYSASTVFFGDCDCSFWTPITSIDIVAHEIAHGVTRHTSGLEYQYQSGGMNEAFSDVVGAVLETLVDDSIDEPDFNVGEMLGNKLRSMEFPAQDGRAIDTVCTYKSTMDVHTTSGPLNKAFVNAVRACQRSGCSDRAGCTVLIGTIFMYANTQLLTTYSTYFDGATATCSIVDEYFDAKSPSTQCSADSIVTFIRQGWATVDVILDEDCQSRACCSGDCPSIPSVSPFPTTMGPTVTPGIPTAYPTTLKPTTLPPTSSPTTSSPSGKPTLPPIDLEDIDGDEGVILRIFRFIFGLFGIVI